MEETTEISIPAPETITRSHKADGTDASSKNTRNIQTQHGDYRTTDEGNIFVIASGLWPKPVKVTKKLSKPASKESISTPTDVPEPVAEEEPPNSSDVTDSTNDAVQVVWIEPFANGASQIIADTPPSAEKRQADDAADAERLCKKARNEKNPLTRHSSRPGFSEERYDETSYYIENGLRKVYPYYFTFTTYTKGRWVGETILDIFSREFRAQSADIYKRCIEDGTLTVNHRAVPIDYKLKHNDLLSNIVHRHEVPVMQRAIQIIHIDDDIVVVNKPSSIPVHPCGRYRHNTAVFILARDYGLKDLRTMHRLDRLTSGLLLFGRSVQKARQTEHQIRTRLVQKQYVCRVDGQFPDGIVECTEPIEVVSYKIGVCRVKATGKDCETLFERLSYNGRTSVVLCKPKTGRMHQIRVHLQYLGYPIANDPLYNHTAFGPLKGRGGDFGGKTDEQLINELVKIHNAESWLCGDGDDAMAFGAPANADANDDANENSEKLQPLEMVATTTTTDTSEEELPAAQQFHNAGTRSIAAQTSLDVPDAAFDASLVTTDKNCVECKAAYRDPKPQDLVMFLHALKYSGPGWAYETPLPEWADEHWVDTR